MLQQLAIVLGILLSFVSNYWIVQSSFSFLHEDNYWRYMLAAAFIPSLIFFLLLLLVPESPRWLILKGRLALSEKIFGKIYGTLLAKQQVEAVKAGISSEGTANIRDVLSPRFKKTVIIGLIFASIAQLTGINIIFYYAPLIFEKTKVGGSVLFQTLLTGIVNLVEPLTC